MSEFNICMYMSIYKALYPLASQKKAFVCVIFVCFLYNREK